jgi:putative sterol carrier protein
MVDEDLLMEFKEKLEVGPEAAEIDDTLKAFKLYEQLAEVSEELREELEDMDIAVQMVITDKDKKFWVKVQEGNMEYGEGELDNPSFTFSSNFETGAGMLFGKVDATSAYMAGDITVEGNLQDAMAFQEIIELALLAFEDEVE